MKFLVIFAFCAICRAAENPYSASIITFKGQAFFIDEDFTSPNNARVATDIQLDYGFPYGTTSKHIKDFVKLYGTGANSYPIQDIQILVENPVTYIRATAIISANWEYDLNNTVRLQQEIFTIQETDWVNVDKTFNISFSRPNWYLAGTYSKSCSNQQKYGFSCNVLCVDPTTENVCYKCDATTGNKTCCPEPQYDPYTCFRYGTNGSVPATCEDKLAQSQKDYKYQKKWRTVFFWIMIGFIVIALILLGIIFCCLFSMLHYKRKAEEQQKVHPVDEDWPESQQAAMSQRAELPYTEIYRQPYKRRRVPSNPPSPDIQRRRAASIATIESELRSSNFNYPVQYTESPRPRRRIEQLV